MLCLKKEFATCLLITTSLFFSTALVFAETATVSWDANTESDLRGYEISFFLEKQREVELKVYNPLGQLVKTLVSDEMPQGDHKVVWDGTNNDNIQVPSGVYIYSLEVKRDVVKGDLLVNISLERRVKKMTLLR